MSQREALLKIQRGCSELGYDPGPLDGVYGPRTERAMNAVIAAKGTPAQPQASGKVQELPWVAEARRMLGRHESRDNALLRRWLASDGRALGDPMKFPWCGDFVETCIRLRLPDEVFPGALEVNPYWARNWMLFGEECAPCYGCVAVWERGSGGHVGFLVGHDDEAWHVIGGNQQNSVTVARMSKRDRKLLATRWPKTWLLPGTPLPRLSSGGKLSQNEA